MCPVSVSFLLFVLLREVDHHHRDVVVVCPLLSIRQLLYLFQRQFVLRCYLLQTLINQQLRFILLRACEDQLRHLKPRHLVPEAV